MEEFFYQEQTIKYLKEIVESLNFKKSKDKGSDYFYYKNFIDIFNKKIFLVL